MVNINSKIQSRKIEYSTWFMAHNYAVILSMTAKKKKKQHVTRITYYFPTLIKFILFNINYEKDFLKKL